MLPVVHPSRQWIIAIILLRFLNNLADAPNCAIRNCARSRQIEVCALCSDFPCARIEVFAQSEPLLLHDGQRINKVGLEQWIEEQVARKQAGFDYGRVRCLPCIVPTE